MTRDRCKMGKGRVWKGERAKTRKR